jgi:hypothetical protein
MVVAPSAATGINRSSPINDCRRGRPVSIASGCRWKMRVHLPANARLALSPLTYTFQHRRHDEPRMIMEMKQAIEKTVDFSVFPKVL